MNRFFLKRRAVWTCVVPAVLSMSLCLSQFHLEERSYASNAQWHGQATSELLAINPEKGLNTGLSFWEQGDKQKAAEFFERVGRSKYASAEEKAASAYWAARAYDDLGNERLAWTFRESAARYSHTFYGLLARGELGLQPDLNWKKPEYTASNRKIIEQTSGGKNALSFISSKEFDKAEAQLLQLDYKNNQDLNKAVLSLALSVDLPSVALHLAERVNAEDGGLYDSAFYPLSAWAPVGGYRVDSSLVHAIIRQESRFQISARSEKGAGGLMQVMPKTARYIAEKLGYADDLEHMKPEVNLRLGQDYLLYLLEDEAVQGDVISMLIAYNAGPGNLRKWQKQAGEDVLKDPLMFIETLPVKETREYVKAVMMNYMIYRDRAGQPIRSLSDLPSEKGLRSFSIGKLASN